MGVIVNESSILNDTDTDLMERNAKEKEYLDYINEHIYLVKLSFAKYIVPILDMTNISEYAQDEAIKDAIAITAKNVLNHDSSKFGDDEFDQYRAKYYPTQKEKNADSDYTALVDSRYEDAWKHHYENNPHHPEHWKDHENNICRDMSLEAILEMICDWEAMSLKFNTNTLEWYETKAKDEKACMSLKTKAILEDLLYNVIHHTSNSAKVTDSGKSEIL